jgi:hypothetical protein
MHHPHARKPPGDGRRRRVLAAVLCAMALALAWPTSALAHGLVGKRDLPIPGWLVGWAAAIVLVISFVALAVLWPKPRWEHLRERRLFGVPRVIEAFVGALGAALFLAAIFIAFGGQQTSNDNLFPTLIFALFWVGLPIVSLLFGDVYRAINPYRAVGRVAGWVMQRVTRTMPEPLEYPARLGHWPAAVGITAFVWVELIYSDRDDPSALAVLALAYTVVQFVGMSLYGVEAWCRRGDAFGVYFGLFARLSPLDWTRRALYLRPPFAGAAGLVAIPGTVALLSVMIGTTSFDGFTAGPMWNDISTWLIERFNDLGLGQQRSIEVTFTVGLLAMILLIYGLYRLGIEGVRTVDPRRSSGELARAFVHSLIPIALAYVIAHYFGLLAYQGQAIGYLASDPLGDGSDLFGLADSAIDYGWISATGIWYVQVITLIVGHAAGLALAHDRAMVLYDDPKPAVRSQYWMLAVMVCFTCFALWLLSASD